jgi:hypothetical protein
MGELFFCLSERLGGPLAAPLGGAQCPCGAVGSSPGLGFGRLGNLAGLGAFAGGELVGVRTLLGFLRSACVPAGRRPAVGRRRLSAEASAEADMAKLALQAPFADQLAGIVVQSGGVQCLGDPIEDHTTGLVPVGAEQATGLVEQRLDRRSLALGGLAQCGRLGTSGEHAGLGVAQRVAGNE